MEPETLRSSYLGRLSRKTTQTPHAKTTTGSDIPATPRVGEVALGIRESKSSSAPLPQSLPYARILHSNGQRTILRVRHSIPQSPASVRSATPKQTLLSMEPPATGPGSVLLEGDLPSCQGCRRRKLRCSRDRPTCTHCQRLGGFL